MKFKCVGCGLYWNVSIYQQIPRGGYISNVVQQNTSKITTLWDAVFGDITTNPFQITFANLDGITLTSGVWNATLQRLEC